MDDVRILEECLRYVRNEKSTCEKRDSHGHMTRPPGVATDPLSLLGTSPPITDFNHEIPSFKPKSMSPMPEGSFRSYEEDAFVGEFRSHTVCTRGRALSFTRVSVPPLANKPLVSGLSMLLSESSGSTSGHHGNGALQVLTIYLPEGDTLDIAVTPALKIAEIIKKILAVHEKEDLQPPLLYNNPKCYQLRIHDMDGEPDEDFPPLESNKSLNDYGVQLNEYCLVQIEGASGPPEPQSRGHDNGSLRRSSILPADPSTTLGISLSIEIVGYSNMLKLNHILETAQFIDLIPLISVHIRLRCIQPVYLNVDTSVISSS